MDKPLKIRLDVWLRFESPDDEEASHEANVFVTERCVFGTDMLQFIVEWYGAGPTRREAFDTYQEARDWLEKRGYADYSSEPIVDYQAWLDAHDYDTYEEDTPPPLTLAHGYLITNSAVCSCCGVEFAW